MELRRRGKWQKALDEALSYCHLLDDDWAHAALFWVVYDMAKLAISIKEAEDIAVKCFVIMHRLLSSMQDNDRVGRKCYYRLLESYIPCAAMIMHYEEMSHTRPGLAYVLMANRGISPENLHTAFHNCYGWVVYRYLRYRGKDVSLHRVKTLLYSYLQSCATRPSLLHSLFLDFVVDYVHDHPASFNLNKFLVFWGVSNLRREDLFYTTCNGFSKAPLFDRLCDVLERCNGDESVLSLLDKDILLRRQSLVAYLASE